MENANILIVEDESIAALDIKNMLTRIGYTVPAVVSSGEKAIEKAAEVSPDLVLMDIMLKGDIDGIDAAEQIRARFHLPVIYITAFADNSTLQRAKITEPYGYVIKPFQERELHTTIEMALYRHKMEEELRNSERKYRHLVENIRDIIYAVNRDGVITYISPTVTRIGGYEPAEVIGRPFSEYIYPDDLPDISRMFKEVLSGYPRPCEYRVLTKSGEVKWMRFSSLPILEGDTAIGIQGVMTDVTERREAEEAYHAIVENSLQGLIILQDFRIVFANSAFAEICGYTVDELTSLSSEEVKAIIHPEDRELVLERMEKRLKGKPVLYQYEFRGIRKDGEIRWLEIFASCIEYRGRPAIQGAFIDITQHKRSDGKLRESEEMIRAVFETAEDCIFIKDSSLKYVRVNPAMEKLFGVSSGTLLNKTDIDILGQKGGERAMKLDQRVLMGEVIEEELSKSINGVNHTFHIIKVPLRDSDGTIFGLCGIARDITERRKMEAEIQRIQRLESIGVLAGGIAHDFNNILTGILGNISLARVYAESDKITESLTAAERASMQARELTQQLLTFSKGGAPIKETASIDNLLRDSVFFSLRGSNVKCEFFIRDDTWLVEIDEGQIRQVINNLVINANQAMPEGGTVRVCVENVNMETENTFSLKAGDYIRISIEDQGIGISEEHLQRIFDPYFSTKQKGSGLGLAASHSIIKNHGGHISVESQIGIGTKFYVYLPATSGSVPVKKLKIEERPVKGTGRILVMDDEEIIRDLVQQMLSIIGYDIDIAADGVEVIRLYKDAINSGQPFNAVIMDLTVPGSMGGKETIQKLKEIDPEVKSIVSSGYSNDPIMANFKQYGFKGVIAKPYRISDLSEVLYKVINETV